MHLFSLILFIFSVNSFCDIIIFFPLNILLPFSFFFTCFSNALYDMDKNIDKYLNFLSALLRSAILLNFSENTLSALLLSLKCCFRMTTFFFKIVFKSNFFFYNTLFHILYALFLITLS